MLNFKVKGKDFYEGLSCLTSGDIHKTFNLLDPCSMQD